ncbi:MAG: flagellar biosynthesis protein FlhF [Candidatus Binatia bacterium]|nr:flagellar biosynthesis protein FlhF [Candidatus Binatia bacterium]
MELKYFWGRDMDEALRAVRATLGPDALILETRSVAGENGTGKGMGVQITAVRETNEAAASSLPPADAGQPEDSRTLALGDQQRQTILMQDRSPELMSRELEEVRQELAALQSLFCWLVPGIGTGGLLEELVRQGVAPHLLARLLRETASIAGADEREKMRQVLTRSIPTGGDIETKRGKRQYLALIGPTGVGKTTTVVKLTVRLACRGDRRIGWVSLDNRRIAGAEQLAVYAGILGVPYEVAENAEGLAQALGHLSACDVVLIDTSGTNPQDTAALEELAAFLAAVPELQRALLLSATTNGADMTAWVERYQRVGFDSLLFTKLDECTHFGPLVTVAVTCGRPLSYVTNGQQVANGLEVATSEAIVRLLLP